MKCFKIIKNAVQKKQYKALFKQIIKQLLISFAGFLLFTIEFALFFAIA